MNISKWPATFPDLWYRKNINAHIEGGVEHWRRAHGEAERAFAGAPCYLKEEVNSYEYTERKI